MQNRKVVIFAILKGDHLVQKELLFYYEVQEPTFLQIVKMKTLKSNLLLEGYLKIVKGKKIDLIHYYLY